MKADIGSTVVSDVSDAEVSEDVAVAAVEDAVIVVTALLSLVQPTNKKANDKDAAKSNDNLRTTFPPFLR